MNKNAVLYLCDGAVETCQKTSCYKRGHECCHTTDEAHAINPKDKRRFVPDGDGNLWEVSSESEDVLNGKKKAVIDPPKMRGVFRGTLRAADFPFVAEEG